MKVAIDEILCSGHGRCEHYADEVYQLDEVGYNAQRGCGEIDVPAGMEEQARIGAKNCPEQAITIIEE